MLAQIILSEKPLSAHITRKLANLLVHRFHVRNRILPLPDTLATLQTRERRRPIRRHRPEILRHHTIAILSHLADHLVGHVLLSHVHNQAGAQHKRSGRTNRTHQPLAVHRPPMMRQLPTLEKHRIAFGALSHRRRHSVGMLAAAMRLQQLPIAERRATLAIVGEAHIVPLGAG